MVNGKWLVVNDCHFDEHSEEKYRCYCLLFSIPFHFSLGDRFSPRFLHSTRFTRSGRNDIIIYILESFGEVGFEDFFDVVDSFIGKYININVSF